MPGIVTELPVESLPVPKFVQTSPERFGWRHWAGIAAGSVLAHFLLALFGAGLSLLPGPQRVVAPEIVANAPRRVTPLIAPPLDVLTQRAPNRGKLTQEFNVASLPPRPAQADVPSTPGAAAMPRRKFQLPDRKTVPAAKTPVPDTAPPPPVDVSQLRTNTPIPALGTPVPAPPPQIQASEKPRLEFEKPGVTNGSTGLSRVPVPRPSTTVEDAARQVARGAGHGLIVGDEDAIPGANPSSPAVPLPGKLGSAVELLSDPQGVDFWPYLVKVLGAVRRNWFAVIPESARFGRQGRTVVQFAISKDGSVPKLVIATPSGTEALDRAAVAGISASNPFPPLPSEFRGGQVRLQFVFRYNVK